MDQERDLTPEETAKMRHVYARLAYGYDFTRSPGPRTPEEQALLDAFAECDGRAFVDQYAELILMQARAVGDL